MKKLNDKVLIVDVESTCWNDTPPVNAQSEIIEIGIAVLNRDTLRIEEKRSIIVRPITSTVSSFCTELTTLTQEIVDTGISFSEACKILRKEYKSDQRLWMSWGDYDRKMFERMAKLHSVRYPFGQRHLNAKVLYGLFKNLDRDPGMPQGLQGEGLKLTGTHHRGHDDAENIARIVASAIERFRL